MRLLASWLANCLGLALAAAILPAISYGDDIGRLALAGAILGVVNFFVRPLVILLALPAVLVSLGAALLVINALMLWLTSVLVSGLHVGGFFSTVAGAALISLVNLVLHPRRLRRDLERGRAVWWLARLRRQRALRKRGAL